MGGKGLKFNRGRTPIIDGKTLKRARQGKLPAEAGKKRAHTEEVRDAGESLIPTVVDEAKLDDDALPMGATEDVEEDEEVAASSSVPSGPSNGKNRKVVVVLEEACLEVVKSKSGKFELLNCDDHLGLHSRLGRDPKHSRPDIAHQCLLTLLDSPLNKAGLLTVYLKSAAGVLVEVSPFVRIPRTYKRFAGLMVQLLHDLRIRAAQGSKTLFKVIKNPVEIHLPINARRFGTSHQGTLVDVYEFVDHLPDEPVVFVFGAMAQGKLQPAYVESYLSFSKYPLSGAYALGRLLGAFEKKWGIV
jgi:rRNA small subunit pseudouridine methyltransferase Nep1